MGFCVESFKIVFCVRKILTKQRLRINSEDNPAKQGNSFGGFRARYKRERGLSDRAGFI